MIDWENEPTNDAAGGDERGHTVESLENPSSSSEDLGATPLFEDDDEGFSDQELEDIPLFDDGDDGVGGGEDSNLSIFDNPVTPAVSEPVEEVEVKEEEQEEQVKEEAPEAKVDLHVTVMALVEKARAWIRICSGKKKALSLSALGAVLILSTVTFMVGGSSEPVQPAPPADETVPVAPDRSFPSNPPPISTQTAVSAVPRIETSDPVAPPVPRPEHLAGLDLFRQDRYPEAIEAFENDISASYLFLARCYQILGENEEALKRYQRVLWEYPDRSAFVEVLSLAEELFAQGDYPAARKLYYAFISQVDQMPGSVKKLVPGAYFKICRCLEEEAIGLLDGGTPEAGVTAAAVPEGSWTRSPGRTDASWTLDPPYKVEVASAKESDFLTLFTVKCVGAPAGAVLQRVADEAGRTFAPEADVAVRLQDERVSAFLKDRPLEEVLEYLSGQIGMTCSLDEKSLTLAPLEDQVQGDWQVLKGEALRAFRRSLYRFLGHENAPKVYFEISRLHYLSGEYDEAISPAKTLIMEYPEHSQIPPALLNISTCYMELGDFRKAREFLSELVNKYTNHPAAQEGYLLLARCWWKEGNPAAAQLTLRSLEDRFPDSPKKIEGKVILARILSSLGKFGDVVRLLDTVPLREIKDENTAVDLLLLKGEAELRQGDQAASVKSLVTLLESFPGNAKEKDALYILAQAYYDMGQFLPSLGICKTLRNDYETCGYDPLLYTMAGRALQQMHLYDRALEWLNTGMERCVEGTRDTHVMYMLLGDILFELKKFERAKLVFRKAWDFDDFASEAKLKFVRSQMNQRDFEGALSTLRGLRDGLAEGDTVFESALFTLAGECYEALGENDAAIRALEGYFKDEPRRDAQGGEAGSTASETEDAG